MSKYLAEEYLIDNLNKNIKLSILRPRAIYGK
jgi:nucleoside-diphosphate-sugar epimerase